MPDERCRLAQLEARATITDTQLHEIRDDLGEIKTLLENQKGFVRGVAFAATAVVTGVGILINYWFK